VKTPALVALLLLLAAPASAGEDPTPYVPAPADGALWGFDLDHPRPDAQGGLRGGGERVAVAGPAVGADGGQEVDAGMAVEGLGEGQALRRGLRVDGLAPVGEGPGAGGLGGERQQGGAVVHQRLVGGGGAVPFQHGELGMVQRAALAVAPHPGELEDLGLAGGQQLLGGELRGGAQVERAPLAGRADGLRGEGVQVGLVAGGALQGRGLDLGEALGLEPRADGAHDRGPALEERPAVVEPGGAPPGGGVNLAHGAPLAFSWFAAIGAGQPIAWRSCARRRPLDTKEDT
jgi:hypothetical protein